MTCPRTCTCHGRRPSLAVDAARRTINLAHPACLAAFFVAPAGWLVFALAWGAMP